MNKRRNELLIMEDRARVCELMLKGFTSPSEIASLINNGRDINSHINAGHVRADLRFMEKKLLEKGLQDLQYYKNRLEAEIILLKKTFWQGYEESRQKKVTIESQEALNKDEYDETLEYGTNTSDELFGDNVEEKQRMSRIKEEKRGEGNPAFLQGVLACNDRLMKIWQVSDVNKVAITDTKGQDVMLNPVEEMKSLIAQLAPSPQELPEYVDGEIDEEDAN